MTLGEGLGSRDVDVMSLGLRGRHRLRIEVEAMGFDALGAGQIQEPAIAAPEVHAVARTHADSQVDRMQERRAVSRIVPSDLSLQVGVESPVAGQHRIEELEPAGRASMLGHSRSTLE